MSRDRSRPVRIKETIDLNVLKLSGRFKDCILVIHSMDRSRPVTSWRRFVIVTIKIKRSTGYKIVIAETVQLHILNLG